MQRFKGQNVHTPVDGVFKLILQMGDPQKALLSFELDQNIYIAFVGHLTPDNRAEERCPFYVIPAKDIDYLIT